jgi:hypothetical protein
MQALSSLQSLTLESRGQPEPELPNWLSQLASLKELTIKRYEVQPLQGSMGHLSLLQSLCLKHIESLTALPQWVPDLISLQQLEISYCSNLNDLTGTIGCLISLNELAIIDCNGITSLPESIQKLPMLKKLKIYHCIELVRWCETEEKKAMLAHIKVKVPGVFVKVL